MPESNDVVPQWHPPSHLTDPYVRRMPCARADWCRASRGRIPELREQAVAARLADYGNKDGTNCHPGVARLASDTCSSERTVCRGLAWLTEHGWISISHKGRRKLGEADVYKLSVPAPVAAHLGWWPEDAGVQWIQRPKGVPKRPELHRGRPAFPRANSGSDASVLGANRDVVDASSDDPDASVGVPPGPTHPGLSTPLRDSITASHASVRGADEDPDGDELIAAIEDEIGGPMRPDVASMVDAMLCRDADRRMIVRVAVARERNPA